MRREIEDNLLGIDPDSIEDKEARNGPIMNELYEILKSIPPALRDMFDRYNKVDSEDTRKAIDQLRTY